MTILSSVADLLARRLDALLQRPDGWGPPQAVELQVLLLLEVGHCLAGREEAFVDATWDRWGEHVGLLFPDDNRPLATRLGLLQHDPREAGELSLARALKDGDDLHHFVEILKGFVRAELKWAPGDSAQRPET